MYSINIDESTPGDLNAWKAVSDLVYIHLYMYVLEFCT